MKAPVVLFLFAQLFSAALLAEGRRGVPSAPKGWVADMWSKFNMNYGKNTFLFDHEDDPMLIDMDVHVVLVGFNGDGAYNLEIPDQDILEALKNSLPFHQPSVVETAHKVGVRYRLNYEIRHLEPQTVEKIEGMILSNMEFVSKQRGYKSIYEVDVTAIESDFDAIYASLGTMNLEKAPFTIFLINPNKWRMLPEGINWGEESDEKPEPNFLYRYHYGGGGRSQSFLASHRYIVIDITAGPCQYGSSNAGEGTVSSFSFPRLRRLVNLPPEEYKQRSAEVVGHFSALILSAVRSQFLPDPMFAHIPYGHKVIIPLIVLRNHNKFNPLAPGHAYSIDVPAIETEIRRMLLPEQELVIIPQMYNLHDHPHLSMSVSKAIRFDTVHEAGGSGRYRVRTKASLDSQEMHLDFEGVAESLFGTTLSAHTDPFGGHKKHTDDGETLDEMETIISSSGKKQSNSHGTHSIPVYVLSLYGLDDSLLIDQKQLHSACSDHVVVLQTPYDEISLPFFSDTSHITVNAMEPTRHIIAGVASALGGVLAPFERFSAPHKRVVEDYTWAVGSHPFGPFSNVSTLSQIVVDNVIRHNVISRIDSALHTTQRALKEIGTFAKDYLYTHSDDGEDHLGAQDKTWLDYISSHTFEQGSPVARQTVNSLRRELKKVEQQFLDVAKSLHEYDLSAAWKGSSVLPEIATEFSTYVDSELETARTQMMCCSIFHDIPEVTSNTAYVLIIVSGGIVYLAVALILKSSSVKNKGRMQ